jgi:hypothetical protein
MSGAEISSVRQAVEQMHGGLSAARAIRSRPRDLTMWEGVVHVFDVHTERIKSTLEAVRAACS